MTNNNLTQYKVIFTGTNGEVTLDVESPLPVDCAHEDNVNSIIDLSIEIGYLVFGEDFRERLDTYAISLLTAEAYEEEYGKAT